MRLRMSLLFFFSTLVTGPRRSLSLKLSETGVYEPQIRACAEFQVSGLGVRAQGSRFRVHGSGFRVKGSGCRVQGSRFKVQGAGCRVQGSGFRVQGAGLRLRVEG